MKRNIYLVGMMGSGKTSVGKILAERIEWGFVDMDETIEAVYKQSLESIHTLFGNSAITEMENSILMELSQGNQQVVACSAGIITNPKNIQLLKATGMIFCLEAPAEVLSQRIEFSKYRFLIEASGQSVLQEWLDDRMKLYQQSDVFISTDQHSAQQIATTIRKIAIDSGEYQL